MLFFFRTLIAWRRFILGWGVTGALVMAAVSFILPRWYTATTSIFPPEPSMAMPSYTELVQQLSAPLLGPTATGVAPETVYIEMLKSRTLGERIIDEFELMRVYKTSRIEDALEDFHSHIGFSLLDNGLLIMTFEDRDPERAAQIANRMIEELDDITRGLKVTRAGRTRDFVGRQLEEREEMLATAETELKDFQQEFKTVDLDEQLRSALDLITELSSRAIALETELQIMAHYTSKSSAEYQRKQTEYGEVVGQLEKLKRGASSDEDIVRSYLPTMDEVPEVALQYMRLRRAVEVQTAVYTMLVNEHEKARIEEARDTPVVQVLDKAHTPNLRSRPKRKILVMVGGLLGLGWSSMLALFVTAWREESGRNQTILELLRPVAADFSRLRGRPRRQ
ncbi:MAG: Wzz/FepE/Etk N-terminal domain-containing protein [Candidatus Krumholzibacteria bacterium]|nr:Wzz/FepE/Etk N-terminal domain-containing protein [Candidatus Krumholzibacteria bacterium]MDH4335938.1 Wzz/FepE/Etk N-terminal domain-containing protein [Candidatus Krumholzibacteria bacterium]MDH5268486.1 Wzz/FepE/Etk N-terminal domain-containing protein [Candidatus Krumholzibacteria bacterium]MDH5627847.1 Wzz/FepE/Etk N-terminal domain-containing protein [Candidatus Krumholzibacteria bacterium]